MYSLIPTERACAAECGERTSALAAVYHKGTHHCNASQSPGICLRERSGLQLINLRGDRGCAEFASAITRILECTLPVIPNTSTYGPRCNALWLGPTEWLLVGAVDKEIMVHLEIASALFTDVSHGRVIVRIEGVAALILLAKGCTLDLHSRCFQKGKCAQTSIANVNILLHRIEECIFDIYIGRSYALHFWQWLTISASEFGYEVAAAGA
jgi:sarcosine oxidase subunit gamma